MRRECKAGLVTESINAPIKLAQIPAQHTAGVISTALRLRRVTEEHEQGIGNGGVGHGEYPAGKSSG